jgi:hypothetical protein
LMSGSKSAPRLPVPPLRQTLDGYLESLLPFIEDLPGNKDVLLEERRKWTDDFKSGIGRLCQDRLIGVYLY